MKGYIRVSRRDWYNAGGFSNTRCVRKASSNGAWCYYIKAL